jgi:hypothetical protein
MSVAVCANAEVLLPETALKSRATQTLLNIVCPPTGLRQKPVAGQMRFDRVTGDVKHPNPEA